MLIPITVLAVCLDGLAIACPGDINPLASADVLHVTGPAASRLDVQNKTVELRIVTTGARHPEVGHELTAVEIRTGILCHHYLRAKSKVPPYVQPTEVGVKTSQ